MALLSMDKNPLDRPTMELLLVMIMLAFFNILPPAPTVRLLNATSVEESLQEIFV